MGSDLLHLRLDDFDMDVTDIVLLQRSGGLE
jgi:hypothetical protein